MKFPMTPAGIEPATFRFVSQHLNHCATAVPYQLIRNLNKEGSEGLWEFLRKYLDLKKEEGDGGMCHRLVSLLCLDQTVWQSSQ